MTYWLCHHTKIGRHSRICDDHLIFVALSSAFPFVGHPEASSRVLRSDLRRNERLSRLDEKSVLLAGALFGLIFCILSRLHGGIGGTLGASAFSPLLSIVLARKNQGIGGPT